MPPRALNHVEGVIALYRLLDRSRVMGVRAIVDCLVAEIYCLEFLAQFVGLWWWWVLLRVIGGGLGS